MAKEIINLRDELRAHKFEFGLLQEIPCTNRENKEYRKILDDGGALPEGVHGRTFGGDEASATEFYTIYETDLTESEIREYLTYKQLSLIRTIKNCVLFFTVLTIIGLVLYFLIMMEVF